MDTKKLRQKILDLAIHGKLVPQDPNDEPASVLLERIREEKERLIKEGKIKKSKRSATSDTSRYENVPFEVPEGWCWTNIDTVCEFICAGGDKPSVFSNTPQKGIETPIYANGLQDDGLYGYTNTPTISAPAITISARGTIGFVCVRNKPFVPIVRLISIVPLNLVELNYIAVVLKAMITPTEGTSIPQLTVPTFKTTNIPIPPIEEQKRIVEKVEKWFSIIDMLENNKNNIQEFIISAKSKILDLAIRGKLVPQDANDEPASELLKRLGISSDNRPYENIPSSWVYTNLGSIFQHNTGKALNKSASQEGTLLPYITTSNVYWDRFELDNVKQMCFKDSELEKCTVKKGDLLVCEGGDIGRSAIWPFEYTICIQNHIHRLRPKFDVSVKFYYFVLMLYKTQNNIEGKGIGMLGLSSGQLDKLIVPVPPINEQKRIVAKIEEHFSQLDTIANTLE